MADNETPLPRKKNKAAVSLGKRGAKARMVKMTAEERSAVAKHAIATRWEKAKKAAGKKAAPKKKS